MPLNSGFVRHASGETTHYLLDDFHDPWKPKTTILIQCGFARNAEVFYHWVPTLASKYQVIRRDLRGHGCSSASSINDKPSAYTLDAMLNDLIDTLDQLNVDKVHFLGESTSGIIGEIFASRHPERLLSLTICSSPTHLPSSTQQFLAMGRETFPEALRQLGSRGWAEELAAKPGTTGADPAYNRWWLDMISASPAEGLASYAQFLATVDSRPYLSDIKVPTLILAPTKSAATSLSDQKEIQSLIKGSKLVAVDGEGHEIYVDKATQCQQEFLDFIDDIK